MTKTSKWVLGGIAAVFLLFILFFAVLFFYFLFGETSDEEYTSGRGGTIAIVELKSEITGSEDIVRQLKKYRRDNTVKAIVLRVDSPGGGVTASQEIYEEVRKTRDSGMPVVVSMGSVAASGGYYVSCGASKIVANPGTLTGSIGVISEFLQFNKLLDKVGVGSTTVKSGKYKDTGSPFRPFTEEDRKYFQATVDDVYQQFLEVVEKERKLTSAEAKALADGRVFTGRRAYALHLVDTLGTYEDAIALAARLAGFEGTPKTVRERKRERWTDFLFNSVSEGVSQLREQVFDRPILQYKLTEP